MALQYYKRNQGQATSTFFGTPQYHDTYSYSFNSEDPVKMPESKNNKMTGSFVLLFYSFAYNQG